MTMLTNKYMYGYGYGYHKGWKFMDYLTLAYLPS